LFNVVLNTITQPPLLNLFFPGYRQKYTYLPSLGWISPWTQQ
jgi:hypothetical protein